jgi:hypothetical protein
MQLLELSWKYFSLLGFLLAAQQVYMYFRGSGKAAQMKRELLEEHWGQQFDSMLL